MLAKLGQKILTLIEKHMMIFTQKVLSHPKFFGVNMDRELIGSNHTQKSKIHLCLLYTSDAADE